jgi:chromosomal replication initiation ATPase DnaA
LTSRLKSAPTVGIDAPDDAMFEAVLVKLFADRQLRIGPEIIAYLAPRMERSFDAARRVVAAADDASLTHARAITVPLIREILDLN